MKIKPPPAGFVAPAQPAKASKPPVGTDWDHEIKHDGYPIIAHLKYVSDFNASGRTLSLRHQAIFTNLRPPSKSSRLELTTRRFVRSHPSLAYATNRGLDVGKAVGFGGSFKREEDAMTLTALRVEQAGSGKPKALAPGKERWIGIGPVKDIPLKREFTILCACRINEVVLVRGCEFDLPNARWSVPGPHVKAGKAHAVMLSKRAAQIIRDLRCPQWQPRDAVCSWEASACS